MTKPPFNSKQEILDEIKALKQSYIDRFFYELRFKEFIIKISVSGSTFRAYRNSSLYTPSSVFRNWAYERFFNNGIFIKEINSADFANTYKTKRAFKNFHDRVCNDLRDYWQSKNKQTFSIDYGQQRKLVDLFLKHFITFENLNEKSRNSLIHLINVPLDKYSLYFLKNIYEKEKNIANPSLKSMKNTVSMGFIDDEKHYWFIQDLIQKYCENYPAIYYDFVAWNKEHENLMQIEQVIQMSNGYIFVPGLIEKPSNH